MAGGGGPEPHYTGMKYYFNSETQRGRLNVRTLLHVYYIFFKVCTLWLRLSTSYCRVPVAKDERGVRDPQTRPNRTVKQKKNKNKKWVTGPHFA